MRRLVVSVIVASGLVLIGAGTASAEPAPGASSAQATAGKKVCKVDDPRLDELSGIVATEDGFVVVNDSAVRESQKKIFFLDDECTVVDTVSFGGDGPRDTEDMILSADGRTLWIADIGDNRKVRRTVALWSMPADGSKKPKIHRLAYPDGAHDAEALLLNGDGTPIVVTKEVGRPAALYTPTAELETDNTEGVPMRKAGELTVPPSETSGNTFARLGRFTIAGGAVALGGTRVALRTYTDALEWNVKDGDVLAALKGEPRVTPLPDEPLGEAITYSPGGKYFYTVSDMQGDPEGADNYVLQYTPVTHSTTTRPPVSGAGGGDDGPSWFGSLSINDITYMVAGVGILGAILVGFGIFGIMRARDRQPLGPARQDGKSYGQKPTEAQTELVAVGGAAAGAAAGRGTGVYGGKGPTSGRGVYGGKPVATPPAKGGGVYGGGHPGAGQPAARPDAAGQQVGRPGDGQPAARPAGGRQPARPGNGPQPAGRPAGSQPAGGEPAGRPSAGQPAGEPGQGDRPGGGQQPTGSPGQGGGVYGAPPQHPQGPIRRSAAGGPHRQPGFVGQGNGHQGSGHPGTGRPAPTGMSSYADSQGRGRGFDNPGYERRPSSR